MKSKFFKWTLLVLAVLAFAYYLIHSSVNLPDDGGITPLHNAAMEGNAAKVTWYLLMGAKPDIKTPTGETPLHLVTDPDVVTILCQRKADVNARTPGGDTPLHFAAKQSRPDIVQRLIECKADVNARNDAGETPLHMAAESGDVAAIALLINHGADPTLRDIKGDTPLTVAQRNHYTDIATTLARVKKK